MLVVAAVVGTDDAPDPPAADGAVDRVRTHRQRGAVPGLGVVVVVRVEAPGPAIGGNINVTPIRTNLALELAPFQWSQSAKAKYECTPEIESGIPIYREKIYPICDAILFMTLI